MCRFYVLVKLYKFRVVVDGFMVVCCSVSSCFGLGLLMRFKGGFYCCWFTRLLRGVLVWLFGIMWVVVCC